MTKRGRKPVKADGTDPVSIEQAANKEIATYTRKIAKTYTTSTGILVKFKSVPSMLIEKVQHSVKLPTPPTYTVKTVTGEDEIHEHNSDTLEVKPEWLLEESDIDGDLEKATAKAEIMTARNKKAWVDYIQDYTEKNILLSERFTKSMCMLGLEFDYDHDGEWTKMQEFLGLELPEEPLERKYHYIQTQVFGSPEDMTKILTGIMSNSGIPQESLQEVEELFRSSVEATTIEKTSSSTDGKLVS